MKKNVYTKEHLLYLASVRRKNIAVIFARALILFALLGIWELAARLNWVNPFVTSSPSRVAKTLGELYRAGTLFYHIGVTLSETLIGFFIAVAGGYVLALLLWWSDGVRRTAEPYLVVINALPKIALGPLVIIWFGTGKEAIICMTVLVGIIGSSRRIGFGLAFLVSLIFTPLVGLIITLLTDPLPYGGQRWGCVGTFVAILGLLFLCAFLILLLAGGAVVAMF